MTVFEIDQPEVIEFKTTTLAKLGAAPQADLRTVAIDLRRDWPKALVDAGFDKGRPTAWIAEGLFGYLPPEAQDRLLDNISALSAEGSRLAVEAIPDRPQQDVEKAREMMRRATAKWRDHGFELDWEELGFEGERNDVADYLKNLGWQTVGTADERAVGRHRAGGDSADERFGVGGRHHLLQLRIEQMTAPSRRGLNDAVTRLWSFLAPAYDLPFLQQWVYRPPHDEVIARLRAHQRPQDR